MCGRYTLRVSAKEIAAACGLASVPEVDARYNIAPGQAILAVRRDGSSRRAVRMRWGLPIRGAPGEQRLSVNVRSETAGSKPSFREAFQHRRCVMPADGFYEWHRGADGKPIQAWHIRRRDGGVFLMAALWNLAEHGDLEECAAPLTTGPNATMAPIHDRMPVILEPDALERWLDPALPGEACVDLLKPAPDALLEVVKVGTYVNSSRHEGPRCLEPEAQGELDLFS
jgi:putative SOS response-associated peptidase YedK